MKRFVPKFNQDSYFNSFKRFDRMAFKPQAGSTTNYTENLPWVCNNSEELMATFNGRCVVARPYESAESLLKRFKRSVESSGVLAELKKREYFRSESTKKKEKSARAQKKARKSRAFQNDKYFGGLE